MFGNSHTKGKNLVGVIYPYYFYTATFLLRNCDFRMLLNSSCVLSLAEKHERTVFLFPIPWDSMQCTPEMIFSSYQTSSRTLVCRNQAENFALRTCMNVYVQVCMYVCLYVFRCVLQDIVLYSIHF